jgi:predicted AAA+ superfamily ATPase
MFSRAYDRPRKNSVFNTGSGRLIYQRGDSLAGRYLSVYFPLTVRWRAKAHARFSERPELPGEKPDSWATWKTLETVSGFPEPFTRGTETFYRRWTGVYSRQVIREEIRDLTQIRQVGQTEILARLLPESGQSLLHEFPPGRPQGFFETIKSWIGIFQKFLSGF